MCYFGMIQFGSNPVEKDGVIMNKETLLVLLARLKVEIEKIPLAKYEQWENSEGLVVEIMTQGKWDATRLSNDQVRLWFNADGTGDVTSFEEAHELPEDQMTEEEREYGPPGGGGMVADVEDWRDAWDCGVSSLRDKLSNEIRGQLWDLMKEHC